MMRRLSRVVGGGSIGEVGGGGGRRRGGEVRVGEEVKEKERGRERERRRRGWERMKNNCDQRRREPVVVILQSFGEGDGDERDGR